MEAKLAAMNLKSAPSPAAVRQFARQSLGSSSDAYLSPHATNTASVPSPTSATGSFDDPAAATLASQRAKLKANSRISAPANILLGASGGSLAMEAPPKSPMWNERDKAVERRSPSPGAGIGRPKSTGSAGSSCLFVDMLQRLTQRCDYRIRSELRRRRFAESIAIVGTVVPSLSRRRCRL